MDRRMYSRVQTDLMSSFIVNGNQPEFVEFVGIIKDVSEGGIGVVINRNDYEAMANKLSVGDRIRFQSVDEYTLFREEHVDVFDGEVEILRLKVTENEIELGCRLVKQSTEYIEYIKNKKMAIFFTYGSVAGEEI